MKVRVTDGFEGDRMLFEVELDPQALDLVRLADNPSGFSAIDRIRTLAAAVIHECLPIAGAEPDHISGYGHRAVHKIQEGALLAIEGLQARRPRT